MQNKILYKIKIIYLTLLYYLKMRQLKWPPLPPPYINYNSLFTWNLSDYEKSHLEEVLKFKIPFISKFIKTSNCKLLDFGCGFGRLASGLLVKKTKIKAYFGYEPNPTALRFLEKSFKKNIKFAFYGKKLPKNLNYTTFSPNSKFLTSGGFAELGSLKKLLKKSKPDIIVSVSVFTHMWPQDAEKTLHNLSLISKKGTIQIITWLLITNKSRRMMKHHKADRNLNKKINGIFTYSVENPLVCTGYELRKVKLYYRKAGLNIEAILYGSWAGQYNDFSYQDVIVSRKIK